MRFILSRFVSRGTAEAAVVRLVSAGFARDDISVSRVDEPVWHELDDEARGPNSFGLAIRGIPMIVGTLLASWVVHSGLSSIGALPRTNEANVALALGVLVALTVVTRLVRVVARAGAERLAKSTTDATEAVVSVRVTESLSRHASRILERSGAKNVSME